jgi:hypothetical protein
MAIRFSCGACGKKFVAKDEHAGRSSKCPACGWPIAVPREMARPAEEAPEAVPPPVPDPPTPSHAEAPSEPARPHPTAGWPILAASVLAGSTIAVVILVAYGRFAVPARSAVPAKSAIPAPAVAVPTPIQKPLDLIDWRKQLLEHKLSEENLAGDRDLTGMTKSEKETIQSMRELYRITVESLPDPQTTYGYRDMDLLLKTNAFFEGDVIDLWGECLQASGRLENRGITAYPMDIVRGAFRVMETEKVVKRRPFRAFVSAYEGYRIDGLSHDAAIARLVKLRIF